MILSPAENRRAFSHDRPAAPRTGQVRPRAARADAFAIRLCLLVLIAWCGATLLAVPFARARSAPLTIVQGKGRLVSLEGPASNVFAARPRSPSRSTTNSGMNTSSGAFTARSRAPRRWRSDVGSAQPPAIKFSGTASSLMQRVPGLM